MRIAVFHNTPGGGAKRSIYEWVRRLSKRHDIAVYSLSSADHEYCDIRPFVCRHVVFDFVPRKLFRSPWGRLNRFQRYRDLDELTRIGHSIAHEIDSGGYDVVFANTCIFTFIPTYLLFTDRPSVYFLHEPFGRGFTRSIPRPYLQIQTWRGIIDRFDPLIWAYNERLEHLQRNCVRRTNRLVANSQFTREQMKRIFNIDAPVCHCGVDSDKFRPLSGATKGRHVLSVGELSPRKGFDFIIKSLGRIPTAERPKLILVCNRVDVSERQYIEGVAVENGVQLQILTHLAGDELVIQYNVARACVYAPVLEPFGLVPLEAMSCGTPVVGVREGGVQETIVHEHTGLLVERDLDRFAAAIQRLTSSPDLAAEYGHNGREHAMSDWTWDRSVESLEKHLIQCSANNRSSEIKE